MSSGGSVGPPPVAAPPLVTPPPPVPPLAPPLPAVDFPPVGVEPPLGGSLPLYQFKEVLGATLIMVPIVNHDNYQHAETENLRIKNLWDGIALYAGLLAYLGPRWGQVP